MKRLMGPFVLAGIAVMQRKLYVLGGCMGQSTVSSCEVLDLETLEWKSIAPMRIRKLLATNDAHI